MSTYCKLNNLHKLIEMSYAHVALKYRYYNHIKLPNIVAKHQ